MRRATSLRSQYLKGNHTPATTMANAAWMQEYRLRTPPPEKTVIGPRTDECFFCRRTYTASGIVLHERVCRCRPS
jgi:hypothetical protein